MRRFRTSASALLIASLLLPGLGRILAAEESPVAAVFVGSTPCGPGVRPFHGVPAESEYALVKWHLTLHRDATTKQPATYTLKADYRSIDYKTNLFVHKETKTFQGKWQIKHRTRPDSDAVVHELESDKPGVSLRLLEIDGSVLQLLNAKGNLMIGDEFQSYTLNRAKPE